MIFTYGLQYLDKAVLGLSAVYTLQGDNVSCSPVLDCTRLTMVIY